jgi:hypothetical protein
VAFFAGAFLAAARFVVVLVVLGIVVRAPKSIPQIRPCGTDKVLA